MLQSPRSPGVSHSKSSHAKILVLSPRAQFVSVTRMAAVLEQTLLYPECDVVMS